MKKITKLRQGGWPFVPSYQLVIGNSLRHFGEGAGKFSGEGDNLEFLATGTHRSQEVGTPDGEGQPAAASTPGSTLLVAPCLTIYVCEMQ